MFIISYIQILVGIVFMWLWGRVLVKNDIFASFLAGAVTAGCMLSFTVRFVPLYTREILSVLVLIGLIKLFIDYKDNNIIIEYNLKILPVIIIVGFFFRIFHYQNWIIESHDILYFSPSIEMLNANYFGNIRVPYYYPYELASNHLVPASFISSIGFLNMKPNLLYMLEIRYLISTLFISNILFQIYQNKKIKLWIYCIGVYFLFCIYGEELSANIGISSFVYVFILFQIFLSSINKRKEMELLFFSILLIAAKTPIFYIATVLSFYLWIKYKNIRFSPLTIFAGSIVLLSLIFAVIIPPPDEPTSFSIVFPFNRGDWSSFLSIKNWSLQDNFTKLIVPHINMTGFGTGGEIVLSQILKERFVSILFMGMLFTYILIKYYLPFYYLSKKYKNNHYNVFFIYMSVSLIGWLIVRNGGLLDHQIHAYRLASIVSFIFILYYCSSKSILYAILPIGLFFLIGHNPTYLFAKSDYEDRKECEKCMKYESINSNIYKSEFYEIKENEPYWKSESQAMILGKRILADDILTLENRATQNFVLPGLEKMYEIKDWTLDSLETDGLPDTIIEGLYKMNDIVIIGDIRFEKVLAKHLSNNEIALYLNLIKYRARKTGGWLKDAHG